jgi:BirA family biotin operon repressor/biotin-[acetyl-CoA-carboxylase] ligase
MAEAAEDVAGLESGTIRLKWPNDLIVERDGRLLKVAGVLGETDGLGSPDPRVVVGIGVNADWRSTDFPAELAGSMTSLRELAGRSVDRVGLLEAFTKRLETRVTELRDGRFAGPDWAGRQVATGRTVTLETHDGRREVEVMGVNELTGALEIRDPDGTDRSVVSAEVIHLRLTVAPARV